MSHALSSTVLDEESLGVQTGAMPDPWEPIDSLGEALHFLRMSGAFYCRSEFSAPWALELPAMESCLMFHVVTAGECRLEVDGANTCRLRPGDLALVPHGGGHRLTSDEGVKGQPRYLSREMDAEARSVIRSPCPHAAGSTAER